MAKSKMSRSPSKLARKKAAAKRKEHGYSFTPPQSRGRSKDLLGMSGYATSTSISNPAGSGYFW